MTEDEIRAAVLAALLDYETLKKDRRIKSLKKTLKGTVMATVIGSSGLMAANQHRGSHPNTAKEIVAASAKTQTAPQKVSKAAAQQQNISGVAHFGLNQFELSDALKQRLVAFGKQLPRDAELKVVGRADSVGGYAYNKSLAQKRAQAVAAFLIQKGVKVTGIIGKVSKYQPNSWMLRRVDVVFKHSELQQVAIELPPILDLYDAHNVLAQSNPDVPADAAKPGIPLVHGAGEGKLVAQEGHGKKLNRLIVPQSSEPELKESDGGINNKEAAHAELKQQKVRGVAHFALNHVEITSAHKERLDSLLKQLPRHAKLVVIGRTDVVGEHEQNVKLGKQRALAVANYLASNGVSITGMGTKASSKKDLGWMARRVDILVNHDVKDTVHIKLPPINTHHQAQVSMSGQRIRAQLISAKYKSPHRMMDKLQNTLKKMDAYQMEIIQNTNDSWDESTKLDNSRLSNTSWSEKTDRNASKF